MDEIIERFNNGIISFYEMMTELYWLGVRQRGQMELEAAHEWLTICLHDVFDNAWDLAHEYLRENPPKPSYIE